MHFESRPRRILAGRRFPLLSRSARNWLLLLSSCVIPALQLSAVNSGTNAPPSQAEESEPKPANKNPPAEEPGPESKPEAKGGSPAAAAGPRFHVRAYALRGDTLLSTRVLTSILSKYTGTNIGIPDILKAGSDLQMEYRDRGYLTVKVTIPPQQITNGIVQIRVFEGFLTDVVVTNNRYFSTENVLRALPSLRTNVILSGPVFQAELDRANANQDRQIYPQLEPGPRENTTRLVLDVKDRIPLHAKFELNNQSSPGTPDLRVNTSAVYNNLWQVEHSFGAQYSFSPGSFKSGSQWDPYDQPLVANYSAFYRMPLGGLTPIEDDVEAEPGSFGYDEATRKFRLPPPSGRAELNLYASRSTVDTGLQTLFNGVIFKSPPATSNAPPERQIDERNVQQDVTVNDDLGGRLSFPLFSGVHLRVSFSGGLDYKTYDLKSAKTFNYSIREITTDQNGNPNPPIITTISDALPVADRSLQYLPMSFHYDASVRDPYGQTSLGLGLSGNLWYAGALTNVQTVVGSTNVGGKWLVLTPSVSRDIAFHTNWILSLRADGQWASEPLLSNEQFGAGGVSSVRGYREGEVFGDTGWHVSAEQKTPAHTVGFVGKEPLTIRGSLFMDYAETYLLDPQGRPAHIALWGTGLGGALALGSHWQAAFLCSWPLLSAGTTERGKPRFNFAVSAQF